MENCRDVEEKAEVGCGGLDLLGALLDLVGVGDVHRVDGQAARRVLPLQRLKRVRRIWVAARGDDPELGAATVAGVVVCLGDMARVGGLRADESCQAGCSHGPAGTRPRGRSPSGRIAPIVRALEELRHNLEADSSRGSLNKCVFYGGLRRCCAKRVAVH